MPNIRYTKGKPTPLDKVLKQLKQDEYAAEPEEHHKQDAIYRASNRCPKDGNWYDPGHYRPWAIDRNKDFYHYTRAERNVYHYMCRRSRPTWKRPCRRYLSISIAEIARDLDLSEYWVGCIIKKFIKHRLLKRIFRGYPDRGASKYELPASLAQIRLWHIPVKKRWRKNQ